MGRSRHRAADQEPVFLGRKYALASGFMEITYDSGAKVILQGPCTYEVESAAGGFLSLGKLTARVESRGGRSGSKGERTANLALLQKRGNQPLRSPLAPRPANPKSEIRNPKALILHPLHPSSLFSVRTPTAIVTDLGTEFGVEVGKEGNTVSHVFRGSVSVRLVGGDSWQRDVVLRENESARAEKGEGAAGPRLVVHGVSADPRSFVRRMAEPTTTVDLVDIMAGGDGLGRQRDRGSDAAAGEEDPRFAIVARGYSDSNRQYHPFPSNRFVDGMFIPNGDGRSGANRLGRRRTFDGFPHSNGRALGPTGSRAPSLHRQELAKDAQSWFQAMGLGKQFMPEGRGLLCLHPNAGITFRLEAVRRAYPAAAAVEFRALLGMGDAPGARVAGLADVWVFVDGRLKWKRSALRPEDGPVPIRVALGRNDCFLSLASAVRDPDSWVVFGDPVLRTDSTGSKQSADGKIAPENRKEN